MPPWNSPCSSSGILFVIIPCNAGPDIPPSDRGIANAKIIQLSCANEIKIKPRI